MGGGKEVSERKSWDGCREECRGKVEPKVQVAVAQFGSESHRFQSKHSLRSLCALCASTTAAVAFTTATVLLVPAGIYMTIDTLPPSRAVVYYTPNVPLPATAPPPPTTTPAPGAPAPALVSTTPNTWASLATPNSKNWDPGCPVVAQESRAMSEAVPATSSSIVPPSST
ncbi:hypothetical protein CONPUDRAFT_162925 [Coniophora puteana RWD-64-598 SS2]|uniref:Uncharacterized protein n=1 Tax=Coniophora puteana (strain RWD-64-598) TaxID=741705 RepID=A0A5M3N3C0_CONPW|nr:uncharacterized protein CONPUDRAFT_162925 [Coniophora puteana RWD-64-598 SS2]EIW85858.1 hypothetical protein CONPUDRAFT_162925 [Coniophora puteana RWD-64-598 SS2]